MRPDLGLLCERRIGQPVVAAATLKVQSDRRSTKLALAMTAAHLWWLELKTWPRPRVGRVLGWRPLEGLAAHTERRRGGRYVLELSWPLDGELYTGELEAGSDADRLVGQLTAEAFARSTSARD